MTTTLRAFAVIGLYLINAYERFMDRHEATIHEWLYDRDAESPVLDALMVVVPLFVIAVVTVTLAIL